MRLKLKIPSITKWDFKTSFDAAENKIPSISNLVKKLTITQKLMKLKRKLLIIFSINKLLLHNLITEVNNRKFTAKLKQENLARSRDIASFVNRTEFKNQTKNVKSNKMN